MILVIFVKPLGYLLVHPQNRTKQVFELVHSDVWGPFFESFDGYKYFVTFIDDFSRVTWL